MATYAPKLNPATQTRSKIPQKEQDKTLDNLELKEAAKRMIAYKNHQKKLYEKDIKHALKAVNGYYSKLEHLHTNFKMFCYANNIEYDKMMQKSHHTAQKGFYRLYDAVIGENIKDDNIKPYLEFAFGYCDGYFMRAAQEGIEGSERLLAPARDGFVPVAVFLKFGVKHDYLLDDLLKKSEWLNKLEDCETRLHWGFDYRGTDLIAVYADAKKWKIASEILQKLQKKGADE